MADDFSTRVRIRAGIADDEDARRLATAVLETLGDHLSGAVARRLAEPLPEPFALPLRRTSETAQPGGLDAFYDAVAERSGFPDAAASVGPVLRALVEVADRDAVLAARDQLPDELTPLLQVDEREGDTSTQMAGGPIEPDAPNVAGPDR